MKIYVYPADTTGCGYFRLLWPVEVLQKAGHDITVMWPNERGSFHAEIVNDKIKSVQYPKDADLIVVQRVSHRHLANALKWIREQGVAIVMDIDDDLSNIHPSNPAWAIMHPKSSGTGFSTDHSWNHTLEAAKNSTLTVVSSQALAKKYMGQHGARVICNQVPDHYLTIPHQDSNLIGWGAALATHPNDAPEAATAISRLVGEGFRYRMVGGGENIAQVFSIPEESVDSTGPVSMDQWPYHLAQFGIGIAPLADTAFNAAKSHLKPLEYAGLGVPCVMSPRAEYRALQLQTGIGVLAERPKEWYKALKKLATSDAYRQDLGAKSREAATKMTYSLNAWRWMEVWEEAVRLQRA